MKKETVSSLFRFQDITLDRIDIPVLPFSSGSNLGLYDRVVIMKMLRTRALT
jgi:hypothetical protein